MVTMKWMMILQLVLVSYHGRANSASFNTVMCHPEERDALLSFKTAFSIDNSSFWVDCSTGNFAKTKSWEKNRNCCKWDGVTCESETGHVVKLDLSCSLLRGSFPSNTTLFRLPRLRHLNLAANSLSGQVPREIGWLSHLSTLDLSSNFHLKMHNFPTIVANLTYLRNLDLSYVSIDSNIPQSIFNLSMLANLRLVSCGMGGEIHALDGSTSILARVSSIDLTDNMFTGIIPGWLFTQPFLNSLSLYDNLFTGISEFEIGNHSSLVAFDGHSNRLRGKIPDGIFELHNLQILNLRSNRLAGTIPLSRIHKLQHMKILFLSDNSLSIIDDMVFLESKISWPSFQILSLSSCNLGHFPDFLQEQENLVWLELSNNNISGIVPDWLFTLGLDTLEHLNLSHNLLQGSLEHLPWKSMQLLDIQYNLFHGPIPVLSTNTHEFLASYNLFTGTIPPSLCINKLELLDLAWNNLTGSIPACFASLITNQLEVLDLRQNQLQYAIPSSLFQNCPYLRTLSLSGNKLEGKIPQSINNCLQMELLDLSSNILNDTFPNWLGDLQFLEVLLLGSNNLHGSLMVSNTTSSFPMVQLLDISNNDFTGNLSVDLLLSMKAMAKVDNPFSLSYMSGAYLYQDSIRAWIKGTTRPLDEIYDELVLLDASWNKLEGPIPEVIGDLISLRGLNLAHNNFTGPIPASLSNMTLLESLDLSFNRLEGGIPAELVTLNYLEFFNVSENDLVGHVPTGKQFDTFLDASYLGNPGLCGPLLTNKCGVEGDSPSNSAASEGSIDESSGIQVWEIGLMGCGCGLLVGLAWGYFIFWQNTPIWVERLIFHIEALVIIHKRRKSQHKRRGTKKCNT